MRVTNQKAATGAVIRTGRTVEEVGQSEGSCQESASNLAPGGQSK